MPLTSFQVEVFRLIARNRSAESFVAGATVLHRDDATPRFSNDIDLFHDAERSVAVSAERDGQTLRDAGYHIEWDDFRTPASRRALVSRAGGTVRMEWLWDSAWRFYPLVRDELMGFRLHMADIATNKALAAAERGEPRDFLDLVHLHDTYLHLGAVLWAACGKSPGFTPALLRQQLGWRARFRPEDMAMIEFAEPRTPEELKRQWIAASADAERLVELLPKDELGCLYVGADGEPASPDPDDSRAFAALVRHRPTVGGAWPKIVGDGRGDE